MRQRFLAHTESAYSGLASISSTSPTSESYLLFLSSRLMRSTTGLDSYVGIDSPFAYSIMSWNILSWGVSLVVVQRRLRMQSRAPGSTDSHIPLGKRQDLSARDMVLKMMLLERSLRIIRRKYDCTLSRD